MCPLPTIVLNNAARFEADKERRWQKVDVQGGSHRIFFFAHLYSLGLRVKVCAIMIAQYYVPCSFEECFDQPLKDFWNRG